ncbi:MAG TPA: hypothetical protein VLX59_04380, partial [Acidimicrobiales bacterium]|nr:hypothetical protein [Acidimicrobiales bacterium]
MARVEELRMPDSESTGSADEAFAGMTIVDADTHLTEPHDLWSSRAPKGWAERLPRVVEMDGEATWVFDGSRLFRAGAMG